jgi:hypothetical protein
MPAQAAQALDFLLHQVNTACERFHVWKQHSLERNICLEVGPPADVIS